MIIALIHLTRQPPLSAEQIAQSATFRRLRIPIGHDSQDEGSLEPQDVTQHIVSDCSVCAAIVVAIDHDRRFASKVCFVPPSSECMG